MHNVTKIAALAGAMVLAVGAGGIGAARAADLPYPAEQGYGPPPAYGPPPVEEGYAYPPPPPAYGYYAPAPVVYPGAYYAPYAYAPYAPWPYWGGPRFAYGYGWGRFHRHW